MKKGSSKGPHGVVASHGVGNVKKEQARKTQTKLERRLLTGRLGDGDALPESSEAGSAPSYHDVDGAMHSARKTGGLADAAREYLEERGEETKESSEMGLSERQFLKMCGDVRQRIMHSKNIFANVDAAVQRRMADLDAKREQRRLSLEDEQQFSFSQYHSWLMAQRAKMTERENGDDNNEGAIGDGNLASILAVLADEATLLKNSRVKRVGDYFFTENELRELAEDDGEDFPTMLTRTRHTQTDPELESELQQEIQGHLRHINSLQNELNAKEARIIQLELFRETAQKRLISLRDTFNSSTESRGKEWRHLISMVADAMSQNERLVARMDDWIGSSHSRTAEGKDKVRRLFSNQMGKLRARADDDRKRIESLEKQLMASHDDYHYQAAVAEKKIVELKNQKPPKMVTAEIDRFNYCITDFSADKNTSGMMIGIKEQLEEKIPVELSTRFVGVAEQVVQRIDSVALTGLKHCAAMSTSRDPPVMIDGLRKLQEVVPDIREALQNCFDDLGTATAQFFKSMVEHHDRVKNAMSDRYESELQNKATEINKWEGKMLTDEAMLVEKLRRTHRAIGINTDIVHGAQMLPPPSMNRRVLPESVISYDHPQDVLNVIHGYLVDTILESAMVSETAQLPLPSRIESMPSVLGVIKGMAKAIGTGRGLTECIETGGSDDVDNVEHCLGWWWGQREAPQSRAASIVRDQRDGGAWSRSALENAYDVGREVFAPLALDQYDQLYALMKAPDEATKLLKKKQKELVAQGSMHNLRRERSDRMNRSSNRLKNPALSQPRKRAVSSTSVSSDENNRSGSITDGRRVSDLPEVLSGYNTPLSPPQTGTLGRTPGSKSLLSPLDKTLSPSPSRKKGGKKGKKAKGSSNATPASTALRTTPGKSALTPGTTPATRALGSLTSPPTPGEVSKGSMPVEESPPLTVDIETDAGDQTFSHLTPVLTHDSTLGATPAEVQLAGSTEHHINSLEPTPQNRNRRRNSSVRRSLMKVAEETGEHPSHSSTVEEGSPMQRSRRVSVSMSLSEMAPLDPNSSTELVRPGSLTESLAKTPMMRGSSSVPEQALTGAVSSSSFASEPQAVTPGSEVSTSLALEPPTRQITQVPQASSPAMLSPETLSEPRGSSASPSAHHLTPPPSKPGTPTLREERERSKSPSSSQRKPANPPSALRHRERGSPSPVASLRDATPTKSVSPRAKVQLPPSERSGGTSASPDTSTSPVRKRRTSSTPGQSPSRRRSTVAFGGAPKGVAAPDFKRYQGLRATVKVLREQLRAALGVELPTLAPDPTSSGTSTRRRSSVAGGPPPLPSDAFKDLVDGDMGVILAMADALSLEGRRRAHQSRRAGTGEGDSEHPQRSDSQQSTQEGTPTTRVLTPRSLSGTPREWRVLLHGHESAPTIGASPKKYRASDVPKADKGTMCRLAASKTASEIPDAMSLLSPADAEAVQLAAEGHHLNFEDQFRLMLAARSAKNAARDAKLRHRRATVTGDAAGGRFSSKPSGDISPDVPGAATQSQVDASMVRSASAEPMLLSPVGTGGASPGTMKGRMFQNRGAGVPAKLPATENAPDLPLLLHRRLSPANGVELPVGGKYLKHNMTPLKAYTGLGDDAKHYASRTPEPMKPDARYF